MIGLLFTLFVDLPVHAAFFILGARLFLLIRVTDIYGSQRSNVIRNVKHLAHRIYPVFQRVDTNPNSPQQFFRVLAR